MQLRVTSWSQVFLFSGVITALAIAVPVFTMALFMWQLPFEVLARVLAIAALIPLFIALPISLAGLYLLKTLTSTIDTLDRIVKFDNLTGVLTRHSFLSTIEAGRSNKAVMLIVDVDHFKSINDNYGHEQGDYVLRAVARILQQVAGPATPVGRMGGEEFAIYLADITPEQACLIASTLGAALRGYRHTVDGRELIVTASIGLARDDVAHALRSTLQKADICLYEAKRRGRDCHVMDGDGAVAARSALAS